ncbi:MAG: phenylalanine--tRNA ligase beta subunit-related protein [Verrucomicrobiota bacterium]
MKIELKPEVFELAPHFHRGIVIAEGINNQGESAELTELLREAEAIVKSLSTPNDLSSVQSWDKVHRQFGSNPNKFPPAHKNLLKRVQKLEVQLPFISKVVAIMNIASLRLQIPVGGDDVERAQSYGDALQLRKATGQESFLPLGKDAKQESPEPEELIYVVGNEVMCRRWNWRNSCQTLISPDTSKIIMNVDCLGDSAASNAKKGTELILSLLTKFCEASAKTHTLHINHPNLEF